MMEIFVEKIVVIKFSGIYNCARNNILGMKFIRVGRIL